MGELVDPNKLVFGEARHVVGGVEHLASECPGGDAWPCKRLYDPEAWIAETVDVFELTDNEAFILRNWVEEIANDAGEEFVTQTGVDAAGGMLWHVRNWTRQGIYNAVKYQDWMRELQEQEGVEI
jgi:hypothetical protein